MCDGIDENIGQVPTKILPRLDEKLDSFRDQLRATAQSCSFQPDLFAEFFFSSKSQISVLLGVGVGIRWACKRVR
jgi:hypothetical protein